MEGRKSFFLSVLLLFGTVIAYSASGDAWTQISTQHGSTDVGTSSNLTTSVSGSAVGWRINVTVNSTADYSDCTPSACPDYDCTDGGVSCEGDTCTRSCTSCTENVGDGNAPSCVGTYCTASCTGCSSCYQDYTPSDPPTCSGCDLGSSSCDEWENTYPCTGSGTANNTDSDVACDGYGSSSNRVSVSDPTSLDGYSAGTWSCTSDFSSEQHLWVDVGSCTEPCACDMLTGAPSSVSKSYHTVGQTAYTVTGSCNGVGSGCFDDGSWHYFCTASPSDSRSCSPGDSVYGNTAPGASTGPTGAGGTCTEACGSCQSVGGECTNDGCKRAQYFSEDTWNHVDVSWSYDLVITQASSCPDSNWCAGTDSEGSCSDSCTSCSACCSSYTPSDPPTCSGCAGSGTCSSSSECDACGTCNFNTETSCDRPTEYPDAPSVSVNSTEVWRGPGNFDANDCTNQISPPCTVVAHKVGNNCELNITDCVTNSDSNITYYGGSGGAGAIGFSLEQYQQKSEPLDVSEGTRSQNTTVSSSTDTQYMRKPFTITNNYSVLGLNTESITWTGDCDTYSNCYYDSDTIASMTPNQETTVYALGSDDKVDESWSGRQEYSTATVNGTAYDSVNLTLTNNDGTISWTNIAYTNSTGCRTGWSTETTSGTVSSLSPGGESTEQDAITCSKEDILFISNAEGWAQDTSGQTTLAGTAYVYGDIRVNNTDTVLGYTDFDLQGATVSQYCRTGWSNTYGKTTTIASISAEGTHLEEDAINCTKSNVIQTTTGTDWQQRTSLTSVVGGYSYIEGKVRGDNTDADVGYSNIYYSDSVSTAERRDGTWACYINDTYSDLSASASSTGTATNFYLNCTKADTITVGNSWNWTQDTSYVTYAGGQSYIIGSVNATNTDTVAYSGVTLPVAQIQSAGCRTGWSYLSGTQKTFDVSASSTSSIPTCIVCNKNNTITDTLISHEQKTPEAGEPVGFWYNRSWENTDSSISFSNISQTYDLGSCENVTEIVIDGTKIYNNTDGHIVENQAIVDAEECLVTIYNQTLTSESTNNVSITYSVPAMTNSLLTEIQGSAYAGQQVPFTRTESVVNTAEVSIDDQPINVTMTYPFYNDSLVVKNPSGTEQDVSQALNTSSDGWVYWVIDSIEADTTEYWTIDYNSTLINLTTREETETTAYTNYVSCNSGTMSYTDVNVTTNIYYNDTSEIGVVGLYLIDNTTGVDVTVASNDVDYGPPKGINKTNSFSRQYTFNIENLNEEAWFKIKGTKGNAFLVDIDKVQITKPVMAGDNVKWRWEVNITNPNNFALTCGDACIIGDDTDEIMSSDAYNIRVNAVSPSDFEIVSGNWWYTNYTDYDFQANETLLFNITFRTPAVAGFEVTKHPDKYWTDHRATISKDITFTNYADVAVTNATKLVTIEEPVGYNTKLFYDYQLVKDYGTVYGQVNVTIGNLSSGESKTYNLNYDIDTAQSYGCFDKSIFLCEPTYQPRRIEYVDNETGTSETMMCQLVKIENEIGRPINDLWFRTQFKNCHKVSLVEKLVDPSQLNGTEIVSYCERDYYNRTEIHVDYGGLGVGNVQGVGWMRICQSGDFEKPITPGLTDFLNPVIDFFQKMFDFLKNFIGKYF